MRQPDPLNFLVAGLSDPSSGGRRRNPGLVPGRQISFPPVLTA